VLGAVGSGELHAVSRASPASATWLRRGFVTKMRASVAKLTKAPLQFGIPAAF
jgi:hypothetical protein